MMLRRASETNNMSGWNVSLSGEYDVIGRNKHFAQYVPINPISQ